MVPESKIDSLRKRAARQEEGAEGAAEAVGAALGPAANIGQILQGEKPGSIFRTIPPVLFTYSLQSLIFNN